MHIPSTLAHARATLQYYLTTVVAAHLWDSGYRQGPIGKSSPLRVWLPCDKRNKPTMQSFPLQGGFMADSFMGFTADGIITDVGGGGLETMKFTDMPVEDLQLLHDWMGQARESDLFPGTKQTAQAA